MLTVGVRVRRVWLARHKVDFRRGHDGLLAESYRVGLQPFAGDVVVFIGRDKRRIKVLYADSNGLWVSYKRFNRGTLKYKFRFIDEPGGGTITISELSLLLDGARYTLHEKKERDPPDDDAG
jgi:transposase